MSDPVGFEINLTIIDITQAEAESLFDALSDYICDHFGGHGDDEQGDCPVQFVAGLGPIREEEE